MRIYRTVNRGKKMPPRPARTAAFKVVIIEASLEPHAKTINALAQQGLMKPVSIRLHGQQYDFNSHWAATDWLKTHGLNDKGEHTWLDAPPVTTTGSLVFLEVEDSQPV